MLVILVVFGPGAVLWLCLGLSNTMIWLTGAWALLVGFPAAVYLQRAARKLSCPECGEALPCQKKDDSLIFYCKRCDTQWDVGTKMSGD